MAAVGLAGGEQVGGRGVGEEVKTFEAFGYAVDVEVVGVDDAYFVVVAEVGIAVIFVEEGIEVILAIFVEVGIVDIFVEV